MNHQPRIARRAQSEILPTFIADDRLKLLMFGGKGGTGKTTTSAASALALARRNKERNILLISTDPAHSLSDSLDFPVGNDFTQVSGLQNLYVREVDPGKMLADFQRRHRRVLDRMCRMSYFADQIDVRRFLDFSLPGMEELMILLAVARAFCWEKAVDKKFHLVVLDTAPTGHTLIRLLRLPEKMKYLISVMSSCLKRYNVHAAGIDLIGIGGVVHKKDHDIERFVRDLGRHVESVSSLLRTPDATEFVPVAIPEELAVAETKRLVSALEEEEIPVRNVLVNRVQPPDNDCIFCSARRQQQEGHLRHIRESFPHHHIVEVPVFPHEIRGLKRLQQYAGALNGRPARAGRHCVRSVGGEQAKGSFNNLLKSNPQFLIFGGKGGVGKTSVSAAVALRLARAEPNRKVLVISTDPAHSLGDSFRQTLGDSITRIDGEENLHAVELDFRDMRKAFGDEYRKNVSAAFEYWMKKASSTRKARVEADRDMVMQFLQTDPAGLEEALALERIWSSVEKQEFDMYILDPAPTGHLIELLEFPDLVREWLKSAYRAMLKYQIDYPVSTLQNLANRILRSEAAVRSLKQIIVDPEQTRFVAVTIAEAMGVLETRRLVRAIRNLGITCNTVAVNMLVPASSCGFCASRGSNQAQYFRQVKNEFGSEDCDVVGLPLFPRAVAGVEDLALLLEGKT